MSSSDYDDLPFVDEYDDVADAWYLDDEAEMFAEDPDELYETDGWDSHADTRDKQRAKEAQGMQVSGRSTKSVLLPMLGKRAAQPRRKGR